MMDVRHCENCEYELIGLGMTGKCPECGEAFGYGASRDRPEPLMVRHGFSIGLGVFTLLILCCGGLLSIWSTKPMHLIATVLAVCAVFGGGAVMVFLTEKKR